MNPDRCLRAPLVLGLMVLVAAGSWAIGPIEDDPLAPFKRAMVQIQRRYVDETKVSSAQLLAKAEESECATKTQVWISTVPTV